MSITIQTSKYLACGLSTLWYWQKKGLLKSYKLSDRVTIFKKSDLDAFINGGSEK